MTPQSSPQSCGSYANAIVHEMQDHRVFPRHGGDVTPHHAHPRHGEEAVQGADSAIAGAQPSCDASCRTCIIMLSLGWLGGCSGSHTPRENSRPTPLKHPPQAYTAA